MSSDADTIVIASAARTPVGSFNGALSSVPAHELGKIAIMAALNITHEFLGAKVGGNFDIASFKRRMASMETVIDQAMSEQTKLF